MQARDISDEQVIELVRECNEARCDYAGLDAGWHGGRPGYKPRDHNPNDPPTSHWANRFDLAKKLDVPDKVLQAKMKRLIERGLILGCACGCRGDFIVPEHSGNLGWAT